MTWQLARHGPQAWLAAPDIFSGAELEKIGALQTEKVVARLGNRNIDLEYRNSRVQWIKPDDAPWLYEILNDAIIQVNLHFHLDLDSLQDHLQLTEYDAAYRGHYGAHIDCDYGQSRPRPRKLSITVQLSEPDEYAGGELLLYPQSLKPVEIPKIRGMATFFRSHVIHEARPVTSGVRRSLVAWVCGPELR